MSYAEVVRGAVHILPERLKRRETALGISAADFGPKRQIPVTDLSKNVHGSGGEQRNDRERDQRLEHHAGLCPA
jgi:hypothetical protein